MTIASNWYDALRLSTFELPADLEVTPQLQIDAILYCVANDHVGDPDYAQLAYLCAEAIDRVQDGLLDLRDWPAFMGECTWAIHCTLCYLIADSQGEEALEIWGTVSDHFAGDEGEPCHVPAFLPALDGGRP